MEKVIEFNGVKFQRVAPEENNRCSGCAFYLDRFRKNCQTVAGTADSCCDTNDSSHHSIFKEIRQKLPETTQVSANISPDKGVKYDSEKPRYDLLPPKALLEAVKNLTFGATKYAPENWKKVPEGRRRYFAAAQRHQWQWKSGETLDPENNLHHLAAAIVNLMFILEKELNNIPDVPDNSP